MSVKLYLYLIKIFILKLIIFINFLLNNFNIIEENVLEEEESSYIESLSKFETDYDLKNPIT